MTDAGLHVTQSPGPPVLFDEFSSCVSEQDSFDDCFLFCGKIHDEILAARQRSGLHKMNCYFECPEGRQDEKGRKNMKRNVVLFALGFGLVAFLSSMTVLPAAAQSPPARSTPYPITLGVGETVSICETCTMRCPAYNPICDDISVATMRRRPKGLEIVGVAPGKTLCSASSSNFTRVPYAVTVR